MRFEGVFKWGKKQEELVTELHLCVYVCVGGRAGEGAEMGVGSASGGEDQESQHGLDHMSQGLTHHTHHSLPHLHTITHARKHTHSL